MSVQGTRLTERFLKQLPSLFCPEILAPYLSVTFCPEIIPFCHFLSRGYLHTFLSLFVQRLSPYLFVTFYAEVIHVPFCYFLSKEISPVPFCYFLCRDYTRTFFFLFLTFYPEISPVHFCYFLSRD